jgi:hypothetical protein
MVILATAGQRHEALLLRWLMEGGAVKRAGRGRSRIQPDAVAGDKPDAVAGDKTSHAVRRQAEAGRSCRRGGTNAVFSW